ncbi:hypothetical protein L905_21255 [Agrobacterium sp. TS43]|nr:hypothetical protein L902_04370 [Agrobacterium radiobacter DSM 30147]KVK45705.1 hypothetical protein L904_25060 [Agrobacterium sp. LY4]KVK45784.1 hypothetical protein L903_25035 [Agrobacterium sp. JL28]KVK59398.1 hypothetical protein L906_24610 [Agrobacterium sp. TS45]KVK62105.1 hypothetical protein L905_21255 [Agrobacterium sp. TS43]KVK63732.1 hypothetical protein L907_24600 [Agrobacterium sp. C13]
MKLLFGSGGAVDHDKQKPFVEHLHGMIASISTASPTH